MLTDAMADEEDDSTIPFMNYEDTASVLLTLGDDLKPKPDEAVLLPYKVPLICGIPGIGKEWRIFEEKFFIRPTELDPTVSSLVIRSGFCTASGEQMKGIDANVKDAFFLTDNNAAGAFYWVCKVPADIPPPTVCISYLVESMDKTQNIGPLTDRRTAKCMELKEGPIPAFIISCVFMCDDKVINLNDVLFGKLKQRKILRKTNHAPLSPTMAWEASVPLRDYKADIPEEFIGMAQNVLLAVRSFELPSQGYWLIKVKPICGSKGSSTSRTVENRGKQFFQLHVEGEVHSVVTQKFHLFTTTPKSLTRNGAPKPTRRSSTATAKPTSPTGAKIEHITSKRGRSALEVATGVDLQLKRARSMSDASLPHTNIIQPVGATPLLPSLSPAKSARPPLISSESKSTPILPERNARLLGRPESCVPAFSIERIAPENVNMSVAADTDMTIKPTVVKPDMPPDEADTHSHPHGKYSLII